ncbi:MAG: phosphoenolpyruvate--protein phosphotransferase [Myxococcota bacterium]
MKIVPPGSGRPRVFRGIGTSAGVAIGRVVLLDRRSVRIRRFHIENSDTDAEIARLEAAITSSVAQLEAVRTSFAGSAMDHKAILEAHEMMLRDRSLFTEASRTIRDELVNAEWAVSQVIARIRSLFDSVADPYFRERKGDVEFAGERILRNLVGQMNDIAEVPTHAEGVILVAHDLSPVDTAVLSQHKVKAFVTEVGGKTSHSSIIARALEIPAVVGAHGIVDAAGSGDQIIIDGLEGQVLLRPTKAQVERSERRRVVFERMTLELLEAQALPAQTTDGHSIRVAGNIELPVEVATVISRGGEAIGLYRTEFMFLGRRDPPSEDDHYQTYRKVLAEVGDRQVTIRTFDLGGDKIFQGMAPLELEANPALGLRAIRYCLRHPEIFEPQIAGVLRAAMHGDVRVMLPMVAAVEEVEDAREVIAQVSARLTREGVQHKTDVPVGIMIEVPSAVFIADHLAKHVDFFAVGTNDLLQFLLAADRTNERVDYLNHPLHPSVLRTLRAIADAAQAAGIHTSVCGEMAGDLENIALLLGLGFDQLSMNATSIPKVKRLVLELAKSECDALLAETLACSKREEVVELVRQFMSSKTMMQPSWDADEEAEA